MSGHSKWSTIKHKKGKTDAARGKIFTKIGRELAVAVKQGGGDPAMNSKLRDVIAKAKTANMPNDNIARTIKKYEGDSGSNNYEEISYEGYGASGVALIVEALTDNRNRSAADIRHIFDKYGAGMGNSGCVAWMFDKKGQIVVEAEGHDEDEIMMIALDAGAEDFFNEDGYFEILTAQADFSAVREALEAKNIPFVSAELSMIPQNRIEINDTEIAAKIAKLIDMLEDNDDVQNVYHNADLPDED